MKKNQTILFILLLVGMNMSVLAQERLNENPLVGMWDYTGNDGSLSSSGKIFLPDGHMYGYRFNQDRKELGTWIMADYEMVNDSTYIEKCLLHSTITFQTDIEMTFHLSEDGQTLTTVFTYIYPNNQHVQTQETWQRNILNEQKYMERVAQNWDALYVQGRKDFGLYPSEEETLEERGEKYYSLYQNAIKNNNLDAAYQLILIRAELDPKNMQWQQDAVNFFMRTRSAPTPARKYAKRYRNLVQERAANVRDTTLQKSILMLFLLTNNPVEKYKVLEEHLQKEEACNEPPTIYTLILYAQACGFSFQEKRYEATYDYALKAIKVHDSLEEKEVIPLSDLYNIAATSKLMGSKDYEGAILLYEKSVALTTATTEPRDNPIATLAICYDKAIKQGRKDYDKKLKTLLKDKWWAFRVEEGQDSISNAHGFESGGIYYILQRGNWHLGCTKLPFNFDEIFDSTDETTKVESVVMTEKGEVMHGTGMSAEINVKPVLIMDNPVLHTMIETAWKMYKKKKH